MPDPAHRQLYGILLCLVVAASFACNTALASVAYDAGATPLSVLTYRTAVAMAALFVVLRLSKVPVTLPPRKRWAALGLGVLLGAYSYGLLGAVAHIPVALAVLTFYLYPLFVGLASWALGQERMTWELGAALLVAFAGLALALDIGGGTLNLTGFGLALGAAVLITILMLLNARLIGLGGDSRPVSLHMLTTGTVGYVLVDIVAGGFPLPDTTVGMAAFLGTGVFYAFSITGIFVAISWIGAVRSSLVMNFEPVSSVFLGTVVLGQAMTPLQLAGAALVVAAIVFTAWRRAGHAAR